jgi:pSer/pThr/pTyr-binding forkhead associated (FHA) protein
MAKGVALLQVIAGRSPIGMSFSIAPAASAKIGRGDVEIALLEDDEVSPLHATISSAGGNIVLSDTGSANGVYVRVREPAALSDGSFFRVGAQLFRFDMLNAADSFPTPDGTSILTSPRLKGSFRVLQILRDGLPGLSSSSTSDDLSIGSDGTSIVFTADSYLSTTHARVVRAADGQCFLHDLGSTNGTYLRIQGDRGIRHGDQILVGNTVLAASVA